MYRQISKEDVPTYANNFIIILSHKWPLHVSDIYMSIFRSSYMLFHCRMWCYAIGVEAVVLRSWCVVLCTVCQLVKIMIKLFASSWYIFLTYIYDARSHLYQKYRQIFGLSENL